MRANVSLSVDEGIVPCFKQELVARLRREMPSEDELEEARLVLSALADKNRLKVLHALRLGGELCVCDVAHVLGMSLSTASHHLRKLRDLRVLRHRAEGRMVYYSIRDRFASELAKRVLREAAA